MILHVRTDAELEYEETEALPEGNHIFSYVVPRLCGRNFVLVSRSRGVLGFFEDKELAWFFIRMRIRDAWRKRCLLDFRLYRWDEQAKGWAIDETTAQIEDQRNDVRQEVLR